VEQRQAVLVAVVFEAALRLAVEVAVLGEADNLTLVVAL
jgi:hypothetical protein